MKSRSLGIRHALATLVGRFQATTHSVPTWLPHWLKADHLTESEVRHRLTAILTENAAASPIKGDADLGAARKEAAFAVIEALDKGGLLTAAHLAARLASFDMRDAASYEIFIGLLRLANHDVLVSARKINVPYVVLHVSCAARVPRARDSVASFLPSEGVGVKGVGVGHVIVVGSKAAQCFDFDPSSAILTVPAGDSYEQLPAKVVAALTFLSLLGSVRAVLKVDDDHRLTSYAAMSKMFLRLDLEGRPAQAGELLDVGLLGLNSRVWHFGKTTDAETSRRPFTFAGTSRYIKGSGGYFLNVTSLALMRWSYVYFTAYVESNLYEDLTVSDLIERQGGRLMDVDMQKLLATHSAY